mgnify:CR=1 FL=1
MVNCDIIILQIHPRCVYLGSVFMNTLIFCISDIPLLRYFTALITVFTRY